MADVVEPGLRDNLEAPFWEVLNVANVPTFCYALLAAYRRRTVRATVAPAASMGLKFGWIELIARQYDESRA